ncbi:Sas10/Utp3/C1D family-domain-containing protein [Achaetomium macrosporum]|uniref:Exosome complex protein n=1 Tax=Achaetomium macrosporum TaxID=79813 RepID=A0AAN7HEV4_9PEZI|nr:Sas10/Utp3/C1D family-domain-containing protein [Achaetomium macrosporum]
MDVTDVTPQLDRLEEELNKAQEVLKPLLGDIGEISSKLPLLDKAKLYVLATYTIESLLFSALRLNGVDTRNHAIFTELTRVKQYTEKIQKLETPPAARENTVNAEAAARFLKSDLGDNNDIKTKLTELIAKEREKAGAKSSEKKRPAEESAVDNSSAEAGEKLPKRHNPTHADTMPRQSRSTARPAPARPTVPARPAPAPTQQQQTRPAATYAAPTASSPTAMAPQTPTASGSQGPGFLGQMASTAAGVAIGSSIGHVVGNGISSIFGGSSSGAPEPAQATQAQAAQSNSSWGNNCAGATEQFTKCMDEHGGNMQICGWYLEQLKACQAAAKQF